MSPPRRLRAVVLILGCALGTGCPHRGARPTAVTASTPQQLVPVVSHEKVPLQPSPSVLVASHAQVELAIDVARSAFRGDATIRVRGDQIAVGAPLSPRDFGVCCGAAQVFRADQSRQWRASPTLQHVHDQAGGFGFALAFADQQLLVGVPGGDFPHRRRYGHGEVAIFSPQGNGWARVETLAAPNPQPWDWFGASLAVDGDRLVVGASAEDGSPTDDQLVDSGAVYVYRRSGGSWQLEARLVAEHPGLMEWFGRAVAVSGDTIVVGAPHEGGGASAADADPSVDSFPGSGAVYVFEWRGGVWKQVARLKADVVRADDWFGEHVAIDGARIAVGAPGAPGPAGPNEEGAVYLFARSSNGWAPTQQLPSPTHEQLDHFGLDVALQGHTLVVGAPGGATGNIHIYRDDSGSWKHALQIDGNDLGSAVAIDGARVVSIGRPSAADVGSLHIYDLAVSQSSRPAK